MCAAGLEELPADRDESMRRGPWCRTGDGEMGRWICSALPGAEPDDSALMALGRFSMH